MMLVSQNKTEIVDFNNIGKIYIDYSNGDYKVICTDINGCFLISLGEYKTAKRAKEALQEISFAYKCNENKRATIGEIASLTGDYEYGVYEMPKE